MGAPIHHRPNLLVSVVNLAAIVASPVIKTAGWIGRRWFQFTVEHTIIHLVAYSIFLAYTYLKFSNNESPIANIIKIHFGMGVLFLALSYIGYALRPDEFQKLVQKYLNTRTENLTAPAA